MSIDEICESLLILADDAPEQLTEYCKEKAEQLGVSEEYFMLEFLFV